MLQVVISCARMGSCVPYCPFLNLTADELFASQISVYLEHTVQGSVVPVAYHLDIVVLSVPQDVGVLDVNESDRAPPQSPPSLNQ
jgi:hypothetical protein